MANENHLHVHSPDCGHKVIKHDGHIDYLHDGHLHHEENGKCTEHRLSVTATNPDRCTADHPAKGHDHAHVHGPNCGHAQIPHGDHMDYLVNGELHHPHGDHCDNHGKVELV